MPYNIHQLEFFFTHKIWFINEEKFSPVKKYAFNTLRKLVLTAECYLSKHLNSHASALTYSTILATVPILAIIFAIGRGLGYGSIIEEKIKSNLSVNQQFADMVLNFINSYPRAYAKRNPHRFRPAFIVVHCRPTDRQHRNRPEQHLEREKPTVHLPSDNGLYQRLPSSAHPDHHQQRPFHIPGYHRTRLSEFHGAQHDGENPHQTVSVCPERPALHSPLHVHAQYGHPFPECHPSGFHRRHGIPVPSIFLHPFPDMGVQLQCHLRVVRSLAHVHAVGQFLMDYLSFRRPTFLRQPKPEKLLLHQRHP